MRIQLLCDHKWRDLPNLTVTKIRLQQLGHQVLISTTKDAEPCMLWFRPDCLVLNHLFSKAYVALAKAARDAGIAVVLLPTEGAVHPAVAPLGDGEFSDYSLLDLYLAWGEEPALAVRSRWGMNATVAPVTGFSRLDFYHERFSMAVTSRDRFLTAIDLDPSRPVVTWATQFPYAHLAKPSAEQAKLVREQDDFGVRASYERIGLDPARIPGIHARSQQDSAMAFVALAGAMPATQFIIRPHPAENRDFYRSLILERNLTNVRFCPQDYIWNVLNVSDVHIHRHCTTAVEAWMWDKPTIELATQIVPELDWAEREAGSDVAADAESLIGWVRHYLGGGLMSQDRLDYRRAYIHRWMGRADGRASEAAADAIDGMLRARGRRRQPWSSMSGVRGSARQAAAAAFRYMLGRHPNDPFYGVASSGAGPEDKLITRRDVGAYTQLVRPAFEQPAR